MHKAKGFLMVAVHGSEIKRSLRLLHASGEFVRLG